MLTRRSFTRTIASSLAVAPVALEGAPRLNIGIGTFSYHTLSIDDMIVQLRENGISEIEMSRGEFMLMQPPSAEMCQSAREKFDRAGIRCTSYYTATIQNDRHLDLAVRNSRIFGASNVSGDATGPMLQAIDELFTREGLTFGIHNHWFAQKFAYESVEDVLHGLAGRSKAMGATLDVGQMAACSHDPVDAVRRLASHLKVVHLKDVAGAGAEHNVLLGTGVANIPGVMGELKKVGFSGLVAIEYEKDTDSNEDMRKEIEYARRRA